MLSSREEMGTRHLASSANSKTFEKDSDVDRSFMKMINKSGPRILPCGTPEMTGKVFEVDCPTDTHWTLFVR